MDIDQYEIEFEPDGYVTGSGHVPADDGDAFCAFHNPSVSPLVFAPIYYSPAIGLARQCSHGLLHPDPDDHRSQALAFPSFAEVVERIHDVRCDGCCIEKTPVEKDDGSHRADTTEIPQSTRPQREGDEATFLGEQELENYFESGAGEDVRSDSLGG